MICDQASDPSMNPKSLLAQKNMIRVLSTCGSIVDAQGWIKIITVATVCEKNYAKFRIVRTGTPEEIARIQSVS